MSGVSPLAQRRVTSIKEKLPTPTTKTRLVASGITSQYYEDVGEITFPEFTSEKTGKTYESKTFKHGEESYEDIVSHIEGRSKKVLQDEYVASGYDVPERVEEQITIPPGVVSAGLGEEYLKGVYETSIGYKPEVPEGFVGPVAAPGMAGFESLYHAKTVGSEEWVKEHGEFLVGEGEDQETKTWKELRDEYGPAMTLEYEEGVGYQPKYDVEGHIKREHERAEKEGDWGFLIGETVAPFFSRETWIGGIKDLMAGKPGTFYQDRDLSDFELKELVLPKEPVKGDAATGFYEYSRAVEEGDVLKIGGRLLETPLPNLLLGMGMGAAIGYGSKAVGGFVAGRLPGLSTVAAAHPIATTTLKLGVMGAFIAPPVYDIATTFERDKAEGMLKSMNLAAMIAGMTAGHRIGTSAYAKRTPTSFLGSEGRVNPFIKKQITKISTGSKELWGKTGLPSAMESYKMGHLRGMGKLPSERFLSMARTYYGAKSSISKGLYKFGAERGLISKKPLYQSGRSWDISTHPELTGEYETAIMRGRGIYADTFASYKGKSLFPGYDSWGYYSQMSSVFDVDLQLRSAGMIKGRDMVFFSGSKKPGRLMVQIDESKIGKARFMEGDRAVVQQKELWGSYVFSKSEPILPKTKVVPWIDKSQIKIKRYWEFDRPSVQPKELYGRYAFYKTETVPGPTKVIPWIDKSQIKIKRYWEFDRQVVKQRELYGRYAFTKSTGDIIKPIVTYKTGTPLKFYHSMKDIGMPGKPLYLGETTSITVKPTTKTPTVTTPTPSYKETSGAYYMPSATSYGGVKLPSGYAMAYGRISLKTLEFLEEGLGFSSSHWASIRPTRDTKHLGAIPSFSPSLNIGDLLGSGMGQAQGSKLKTGQQLSQAQMSKLGVIQTSAFRQLFGVERESALASEQATTQSQKQKLAQKLGFVQITIPVTTTVLPPLLVTTEEEKPPRPIPPLIGEPISEAKFTPFALWLPPGETKRKKTKKKKKKKGKHGYRERVHPVGFFDWMGGMQ